jgi:hypothetical protein
VTAILRVERVRSEVRSSLSSVVICRLTAAEEIRSCLAAAVRLPLSTTRTKVAILFRRSMNRGSAIRNLNARVFFARRVYRSNPTTVGFWTNLNGREQR